MLYYDNHGRLLIAQEHADRLARDYGRLRGLPERRLVVEVARFLSRRRRRRRFFRARAYSA
jgi:hypothetical protein